MKFTLKTVTLLGCLVLAFVIGRAQFQVGGDINGMTGERLGNSVSMSADGKRMAVGAAEHSGGGKNLRGRAQVFEYNGSSWQQLGADILGDDASDRLGWSVSLSADGNRLAVGAHLYNFYGAVRIFEWNGSNWNLLGAEIGGSYNNERFGIHVSLAGDGNRVAIGNSPIDGNGDYEAGDIKVYEYNGSSWTKLGAEINSKGTISGYDIIGSLSISKDGKRVAFGERDYNNGAGLVRIFEYIGSSWQQIGADIIPPTGNSISEAFGHAVSLSDSGNRIAIGAPKGNAVRMYEFNGSSWQQMGADIDGETSGDQFGWSVSLSADGNRAAIGAPDNIGGGGSYNSAGHVRLFDYNGSGWSQRCSDIDGDATDGHFSGNAVSLSHDGKLVAVGAPLSANQAGRVRVYEAQCCTPAAILAEQNCSGCSEIRINVCQNATPPDLNQLIQTNTARDAATSLKWYADNSGSQGTALGTAPTINTANKGKNYFWVTQDKGNNCESPARKVRVKVNPISMPVFSNIPGPICGSPQLDLAQYISDPTKKANKFTFYTQDPATNPNATPIGSVKAKKGMVKSGETMIITPNANTPTYWAKASSPNGCGGVGSTTLSLPAAIATVNPIQNLTVTAGDPINIPMSAQNATLIIWSNHPAYSNPNIGIMGTTGTPPLAFTAQNAGNTNLTAKIKVIPYNGNCAGTPLDFNIIVKPAGVPRQGPVNSLQLAGMQLAGGDAALNWEIVYDQDLLHFEVEKEVGEGKWTKIGEVASHGNGSYGFTDQDADGVNRYRLHLVHADGRSVWSNVVLVGQHHDVDLHAAERFTLYPNPTAGRVTISQQGAASSWQWELTDLTGKMLRKGSMEVKQMNLDVSALPSGMYHLRVRSSEGHLEVLPVIKN